MERAIGIGGFFFVARAPDRLARWYEEHLGVPPPPASYDIEPWQQQAGPTIVAPFASDASGPHTGTGGWGLNLRVADLDAMVAQLTSAGIAVEVDPTIHPNGRFAQLADPEGNAIQLWEVAATSHG